MQAGAGRCRQVQARAGAGVGESGAKPVRLSEAGAAQPAAGLLSIAYLAQVGGHVADLGCCC
jgi:hypothetical protein